MKALAVLIFAFLFLSQATASAVENTRACCDMEQCDLIQCIDMGCATACTPIAAAPDGRIPMAPTGTVTADLPVVAVPQMSIDVWTPPD